MISAARIRQIALCLALLLPAMQGAAEGARGLVILAPASYLPGAPVLMRVEIQKPDGQPVPGFALADCQEVFGDDLQRTVTWKGGADVSKLAGQPVRLRFALRDADLFSFQFARPLRWSRNLTAWWE